METPTPDPPTDADRLTELEAQLAEMQQRYDQSQETITALERRQKIDALLAESDAIDLDAARLLTEVAVSDMDEPDIAAAVSDLRRHKPYLFNSARSHDPLSAGAQSPRLAEEYADPADFAEQQAQHSGDRRDLLKYLRLKRQQ